MKKRALLLDLIIVLLPFVGFVGCQRGRPALSSTTTETGSPITFTFFNEDATEDMPFTDPVAKKITERTGVTLMVERQMAGDRQAVALMIAAGQYPDLIFAKGNIGVLIEAGGVIPLDDLIESSGSNMKKLYGDQLGRLRNTSEDPHIYTVGAWGVKNALWETDGTLQLQHAVLKELGYPRMQTLDDYERAIKAYMERYPTINGQKTIGLSLLSDTWQWYISISDPSGLLVGHPHDGVWAVNQQTLETTYKFLVPEIQLWYRWLNRMNAEGLLDPESFTQREDVWHAKIASGRVLGLSYPLWGYSTARASLISEGMPERTYAYLPIVADERFTNQSLKDYGIGGGHGISISSSCRDPERAFEFLDWLCTEESNTLRHFGIEGVNYHIIDGRRVVPEEELRQAQSDPNYARRTGIGQWINAFPLFGNAYIDSTGNPMTRRTPETIKQSYLDVERETLAAYGAEMWVDLFPSTESLGVSRYSQAWQHATPQDINVIVAEADNYMKTALANIVLGKPEDFDASWQKIQNDLYAMRIEEASRAMTALIRDKVSLWNRYSN